MKTITKNGVEVPLQQNFYYYKSASTLGARFSGAYIFRPDGSGIYTISTKPEVTVYKGKYSERFSIEAVFTSYAHFEIHYILLN